MSETAATPRRPTAAFGALLRVYAHVLFARSPWVGALLLLATATDWRALLASALALAVAATMVRWLGFEPGSMTEGPYGYNALLVGLGVAHTYAPDAASATLLVTSVVACVFVTAALASFFARTLGLPVLSVPFLVVFALLLGVGPYLGVTQATPSVFEAPETLPRGAVLPLEALGSIFFLPRADAGALVLAALLLHSRIATLLAVLAASFVALLVTRAPIDVDPTLVHALGFNAVLTAMALGSAWYIPSRSSFALALGATVLSAIVTLGLRGPLSTLGIPLLILPFNVSVLLVLFAMRQRVRDERPKSVDFVPGTPEENLAYFHTRLARFPILYGVAFRLPFRGTWVCTQSIDGPLTHKGPWRHAFDFEVKGPEGDMFRIPGATPEDYHCFRLPVLAPADGTVVKVQSDVPDNPIGGLELERNWGNLVLVYHAPGVYSLVAHLARGSVKVSEGQFVKRGDTLGLAGNSGRSPRPHLHFQLQTTHQLGAQTLPCCFQDVVLRDDDSERLELAAVPREGESFRNQEPDEGLAPYFGFEVGEVLAFDVAGTVEHVECDVDLLGRLFFRSRERGAVLYFGRTDEGFTAYDVLGAPSSVLHLLRTALSRIRYDGNDALTWLDYVPSRRVFGPLVRVLTDFVAPFAPRPGLEVRFAARREGDLLVVTGASTQCDRDRRPLLRTKVTLSKGRGPRTVEVEFRRKHLGATQLEPVFAPVAPATTATRVGVSPTFTGLRRIVMKMSSWSMVLFILTAVIPATAAAPATGGDAAMAFQRSYDSEAAGRFDHAVEALDSVPAGQKVSYVADLRRGWLLYQLGKSADAVTAYSRAIAADPGSVEARVGILAPLLALKRWADVETHAREALKRDPGNYLANLRMAFAMYNLARFAEAETTYRALLALYPSDVEVRSGLGWSQLKQKKNAAATETFNELLTIAPRHTLGQEGLRAAKR